MKTLTRIKFSIFKPATAFSTGEPHMRAKLGESGAHRRQAMDWILE